MTIELTEPVNDNSLMSPKHGDGKIIDDNVLS